MSQYNGRKIIQAQMEGNIFIPGFGDIKKELSSSSNSLTNAITMRLDEPFVILEIKNKQTGTNISVPVPVNRFTYLITEKELTPPPKPLK